MKKEQQIGLHSDYLENVYLKKHTSTCILPQASISSARFALNRKL